MSLKINIKKTAGKRVVGLATVTVNDLFVVSGFKIWKNKEGYRAETPMNRYESGGEKKAFPFFKYKEAEHQESLEEAVLKAYLVAIGEEVPEAEAKKELEPAF